MNGHRFPPESETLREFAPDYIDNEVHLHPVTMGERAEIVAAVAAMIAVLPEGDDDRCRARTLLVSALDKLDRHWCPWCPVEVRDLFANAHNAFANYGYAPREARKIGDLGRTVAHYQPALDEHFEAIKAVERD